MNEWRVLMMISKIAEMYYKKTDDKWWKKLSDTVEKRINNGNYYDKWSRQGMTEELPEPEGIK